MRRLWNWFLWLSAHVVALDHTSSGGKGGTTFYYAIEIDGRKSVQSFRVRLPVGGDIGVLTWPDDPHKLTPGDKSTSAFDIFAYSIGGRVMAAGIIILYVFLIFTGPKTLMAWIRHRRLVIDMK